MRKLFFICATLIVALTFESCSANFNKLIETGKYKEAEGILERMKGENQNECDGKAHADAVARRGRDGQRRAHAQHHAERGVLVDDAVHEDFAQILH